MMILFILVIGFGIYFLLKDNDNTGKGIHNHKYSAIDELKIRYAKGEIQDEEYQKMLKLLSI